MPEERKIRVSIFRFNHLDGKEPRYETYEVPLVQGMSVLNVLQYIQENIARDLAFYCSCRIGRCGGCDVIVNGVAHMACSTLATDNMTIEPAVALGFKPIKDLIANDIFVTEKAIVALPYKKVFYKFSNTYDRLVRALGDKKVATGK